MRTSADKMISAWWWSLPTGSSNALRCPDRLYLGHRQHSFMNHLGHSNSFSRAFFHSPLGTFEMDLSPSLFSLSDFCQWMIFVLWMRPHEDEHSTSFALWEEPGFFFFLKATLVPSIYSAHGTICLMKLDLPHDGENPAWHVS